MPRDRPRPVAASRGGQLLAAGRRAQRGGTRLLQHHGPGLLGLHPLQHHGDVPASRDLLERVDHSVGAGSRLPVRAHPGRSARAHQVPPLLNPWFSPGAVDRAEPMARAICQRLVAEVAPRVGATS